MRDAFANEITQLAATDNRIVMLSGDIGNRLFDPFKKNAPDRFFNCGVAEANMIGVSAGMAMTGLRPIVYTINSFVTARCYEQIRVDLCYQHLPVVIVGVGGGLGYAGLGGTHHSCEDIASMRVLPGMTVLCPADPMEVRSVIREAVKADGPVYIRLGKKGEANIHKAPPPFKIGQAIPIQSGKQVALLSTGNVLPLVMEGAELLKSKNISAEVISFPCVKPLDQACLKDVFTRFPVVATIEEHSVLGGFSGAVAEWYVDHLAAKGTGKAALLRFGTRDAFLHEAGEQEYARERLGLSAHGIADAVAKALK